MKQVFSFAAVLMAAALFVASASTHSTAQTGKGKAGGGGNVAAIYDKDCAKCHGAKGEGLKTLDTPNFQDPKWQAGHTDKKLSAVITNGEGVMPGFKGKLTPAQITALVKHVRAFAPKAAPAKK
jgi:mono/diheme cytochrome c family protein